MYLYFKYIYAHYQVLALPQMYIYISYTTLNLKDCKINNATGASAKSKKVCDISKGGGGVLQKNVHMTFLVDKIDLWRFPRTNGIMYYRFLKNLFCNLL